MAYPDPYTALWNQQTRLFSEIDQLRYHTADIERQLLRSQQILASPETKRLERRKARWVAKSQQRYLKDLERNLQFLLQSLSLCQAHIAHVHVGAMWKANDQYDTWIALEEFQIDGGASTQDSFQQQQQQQQQKQGRSSPDSGFSEPALYAQPFDLDLSQDQSNHVYSHELQHPLALTIDTTIPVSDVVPVHCTRLSPTANAFTPPNSSTRKAISPLATPFSPLVFAKANPPCPSHPINTRPLFKQPIWWTSSFDWSEQVAAEMTPISPMTARVEGDGKEVKKRYSIAAIELIESRLRQKRRDQ